MNRQEGQTVHLDGGNVEPDVKKEIGLRIRTAREAAGLTQAALGREVGVSQQEVSNWEAGVHSPNSKNLENISKKKLLY